MQSLIDVSGRKPKHFKLTSESVNKLKNKLAQESVLTYSDSDFLPSSIIDAPDKAVCAINKQVEKALQPIIHFLKWLAPSETR